jgi:hypothetical protein
MEQKAPPEPETEDAQSGTRIHQFIAGDLDWSISPDEEDMALQCVQLAKRTRLEVLGGEPQWTLTEQRLWLHDQDSLTPLCSGQLDFYAKCAKKVLIVDYKTGRTPIIAEESWQLRCLAALAVENCLVTDDDELTVAIVQPWQSPQVRLVSYTTEDRLAALEATRELAIRIAQPGRRRNPSEAACTYCRGKSICPDAHQVVKDLSVTILPDGRQGEVLDGATAAALLDRCGLAQKVIGSIQARAKAMLSEKPDAIPGWRLKDGAMREKIVDVQGVWNRMATFASPSEFAKACSLTKTNAKALLRSSLGLKGRALDEKLTDITAGCIEAKRAAPQLVRANAEIAEGETETDA